MSSLWVHPEDLGDYANTEFAQEACETASYLMWAMSGRKYSGETVVTERYICKARNYRMGASSQTYTPMLAGGDVYNVPVGRYNDFLELASDGLSPESRLRMRGRPVTRVYAVRNGHNNQLIDESSYYLVDHSTLHIKSTTAWTPCNVEITYAYGSQPPVAGRMAARHLALEFAKLWSGDDCSLPQRVTNISRQGVSYTLLDSQDFIADFRTGVYAVDLFLKTANPSGAQLRSRVFTPDVPRARRYTPKPLRLTASVNDVVVPVRSSGSVTFDLAMIDGEFLLAEDGWTVSATLRNYSGSKGVEGGTAVIDGGAETLTLTVPFDAAQKAVGLSDPGTYDLHASRPNESDPTVMDVVSLVTGNLSINLVG